MYWHLFSAIIEKINLDIKRYMLNTYLLKTSKDNGGLVIVLYPD